MAIKPSDITPEMVKVRINKILELAVKSGTDFELILTIKQLSNWSKAKRRQVFRGVLKKLIEGNSNTWDSYITNYLREKNIRTWYINTDIIAQRALKRVITVIQEMEKNNRFIPEKVFTINRVPLHFFANDPEIIEYLIKKNIIVFSHSIHATSENSSSLTRQIQYIHNTHHNLNPIKDLFIDLGINPYIVMDFNKMKLIIAARVIRNINILLDIFEKMNSTNSVGSSEFNNNQAVFLNAMLQILYKLSSDLNKPLFRLVRCNSRPSIDIIQKKVEILLETKLMTEEEASEVVRTLHRDSRETSLRIQNILGKSRGNKNNKEIDFNPYAVSLAI